MFVFTNTSTINVTSFLAALASIVPGTDLPELISNNGTALVVLFPSLAAAASASSSAAQQELRDEGFSGLLGASAVPSQPSNAESPKKLSSFVVIAIICGVALVAISVAVICFRRVRSRCKVERHHVDFHKSPEDYATAVESHPHPATVLPVASIQQDLELERRATCGEEP
jgi:hypothetical protein